MVYGEDLHRWIREHPTGGDPAASSVTDGDSLAERVRRRRKGGAA
jgi:hypothetical protein